MARACSSATRATVRSSGSAWSRSRARSATRSRKRTRSASSTAISSRRTSTSSTQGDDRDFVKVLDFGIAKILRGSDFDAADITNAGQMIGTLDYMSPEQMVGGGVTGQTDIYTLGIVMYEMIAGTRPFPEAKTAAAALAAMLKLMPTPLLPACVGARGARPHRDALPREGRRAGLSDDRRGRRGSRSPRPRNEQFDDRQDANARRRYEEYPKQDDDDDSTTITPPPERVLDALRTPKVERIADLSPTPKVEKRQVSEWGDDESVDATVAMQRPRGDATTPVNRSNVRADSVDATVAVPRSGRAGSVDPTVAVPRQASIDDRAATRHDATRRTSFDDAAPTRADDRSRSASIEDRAATRHDDRGPNRGASIDDRAATRHDDRGPNRAARRSMIAQARDTVAGSMMSSDARGGIQPRGPQPDAGRSRTDARG